MKPLPYEIPLPDGELLENGTMFVRLPTLSSLEIFWEKNKSRFSYAVQGSLAEGADPFFHDNDDWIFGSSKASVIETLLRWGDSIIDFDFIEFAEWVVPAYLNDREVFRTEEIEKGRWTDDDEQRYRADCEIRTLETYKGCWDFKDTDKFSGSFLFEMGMPEELIDPTMPREKVAELLFPWLFDESVENGGIYFSAHDSDSIDETIKFRHMLED